MTLMPPSPVRSLRLAATSILLSILAGLLLAAPVWAQSLVYADPGGAIHLDANASTVFWNSGECSAGEFVVCRVRYIGMSASSLPATTVGQPFNNSGGPLNDNLTSNIAVEDNYTYWLNDNGEVVRRTSSYYPGTPEIVSTKETPGAVGEVATDGTHVYWIENVGAVGRIFRAPLAGGPRQFVTEASDSAAHDLQTDRTGRVYFLADINIVICCVDVLFQVAPDGGGGFTTTYSARSFIDGYALSSDEVFVASRVTPAGNLTIARANLSEIESGAAWTNLYNAGSVGPPSIQHLALSEDDLFWHEVVPGGGSGILRMSQAGGPAGPITPPLIEANDLVIAGAYSQKYVVYLSSGSVYRIAIDAGSFLRDLVANEIALEVTQAIQDPANTVPLVEGKRTFARAYARLALSSDGATQLSLFPNMLLTGTRGGAPLEGSPLRPLNPVQPVLDDAVDRTSPINQFLFELPESWTAGTVQLTATVDPRDVEFETNEANNSTSRTVTFDAVGGVCIDIIPVLSTNGVESGLPLNLRRRTFARARSLMPTDDLVWVFRGGSPKSKPWTGDPYNFAEADDINELMFHWWWDFLFASDPPHCEGRRTIRAGVVSNARNFGISSGAAATIFYLQPAEDLGFPAENRPRGGVSGLAHEVGHQLGQGHVGCPLPGMANAPDGPDGSYPYAPCTIEDDNTDHLGFDVITQKIIVPFDSGPNSLYQDYMSYQANYWTSDYVYRNHFTELSSSVPSPPVAGSGPLLVSGYEARDGTVSLAPAYVLDAPTLARAEALLGESTVPGGDLRVRIYDDNGVLQVDELLFVSPILAEEEGEATATPFFGLVETQPNYQQLQIVEAGTANVLASLVVGVTPPTVTITSPTTGGVLGDPVTVSWVGHDPDGDLLEYRLLFSDDGGATWIDLVTTRNATANVPMIDLPTGSGVLFKVLVSDGLRSDEDVVGPFFVANRPPSVAILLDDYSSPGTSLSLPFGAVHTLRGEGYDSDDGRLTGGSLYWSAVGPVTRDGTGEDFPLTGLPPGSYVVELLVFDSGQLAAAASLPVTIQKKTIASGQGIVLDGHCLDPAYAADPNRISLRYDGGEVAEVAMVQVGAHVHVCASGLPTGSSPNFDFFDVRIDTDGSGDPLMQPGDRYFRQHQSGASAIGVGTGQGGQGGEIPDSSNVDATIMASDASGEVWSVEMRLHESLIGPDAAVALLHVFDAGARRADWPIGMDPLGPVTWGGVGKSALPPGTPRVISWEGVLQILDVDTGNGAFTGGVPGQTLFDGYFVHPDTCDVDCTVSTFSGGNTYRFVNESGSTGRVRGVGAVASPIETLIDVLDDSVVDSEVESVLQGLGFPVQVGQIIDGWRIASRSAPEGTPGEVEWSVFFLYTTSDPLSSTEFVAEPPTQPDLIAFQLTEDGNSTYQVFGTVTSVPEPGGAAVIALGALAMAGLARIRRGSRASR